MSNYLIIAASSSMGQATVKLLQNAGHNVFTTARNEDKILPDAVVDASDFDKLSKIFEEAKLKLGKIDGVVCFAGSLLLKKAHFTLAKEYEEVMNSSLRTAFSTVKNVGQHIEKDASIVLISSAVYGVGLPNHEAIAAAKAGVIGLMRSAAATYADRNLRFNAIAPGLVESDLTKNIVNNKSSLEYSLNMHPLHRVGNADDIARVVVFLLDTSNTWITGEVISVDGGLCNLKTVVK